MTLVEQPVPAGPSGDLAATAVGLYCRPDDRGDPVVQLAAPLICGQPEFDETKHILCGTRAQAWSLL